MLEEGRFFISQWLVGRISGCFREVRKNVSYEGEFLKTPCKANSNAPSTSVYSNETLHGKTKATSFAELSLLH